MNSHLTNDINFKPPRSLHVCENYILFLFKVSVNLLGGGGLQTFGQIFFQSIILKFPPIKICSENTENDSVYMSVKMTVTLLL